MSQTDEELIEKTNDAISELVYDKDNLQKAYNYYNGKRDAEQFRYLEENFGIGNPTSIEFTPLLRKHVDALLGEYLGTPILPKVSCKDSRTISSIAREKELSISASIFQLLQKQLKSKLMNYMSTGNDKDLVDPFIQDQINKLVEDLDSSFVSQYEIAAQNVVEYIMQSRNTDLITKLRMLILDLLITGYTFYQTKKSPEGTNVQIEVLSPLNTFIDKNPNSPYVKDSYRVVIRRWLTRTQILNMYGKELSSEDIESLKTAYREERNYNSKYVKAMGTNHPTLGIVADTEVFIQPGFPNAQVTYNPNYEMMPVYEVEWLETDKDFVMQRYSTIRIGENIYIIRGKDENVVRSQDNKSYCCLSVNGVYFENRNQEPFSLILACAHLQDKYDLLNFYRDNLIANSGTQGDWIDESLIPTNLGVNWPERVKKWLAYKKQGIGLIDTTQEGRLATGQAPINTIFNGFDDTVKVQSIQAIQVAIDSIEQTVSSITGVFRERLNGIEAHDAVTNVKIGQANSFTVSKQWYQHMDTLTEELLLDCLNTAKVVYKKGLTGTLILGDKYQKIFTALPEHFTLTDYDIHVTANSDIVRDMEQIRAIIPEFVKAGSLDPGTVFEALTAKSLTDMKYKVQHALKKQKEENNQLGQAQQQLQQMQQQLQQAQQQLQQAQQKIESLNEAKLQLEQQKLQVSSQVDWFKAQTDRNFKVSQADNDTKRTEIEVRQLRDGNPYNDEIKNV